MPRNNWTPVVLDLLYLLTEEGGARLDHVDDGVETTRLSAPGEVVLSRLELCRKAAEAITAVDECYLTISMQFQRATLCVVLGNEPEEIVADWSAPEGTAIYWMLEAITSKFSRQWEGKPCPVIEDEEPEPISREAYINAAERMSLDTAVEIAPGPEVAISSDGGAYVAARIWVADSDVTAEDRK